MDDHDCNRLGSVERLWLGNDGSVAGTIRMVLFFLAFVVIGGGFFILVRH